MQEAQGKIHQAQRKIHQAQRKIRKAQRKIHQAQRKIHDAQGEMQGNHHLIRGKGLFNRFHHKTTTYHFNHEASWPHSQAWWKEKVLNPLEQMPVFKHNDREALHSLVLIRTNDTQFDNSAIGIASSSRWLAMINWFFFSDGSDFPFCFILSQENKKISHKKNFVIEKRRTFWYNYQ